MRLLAGGAAAACVSIGLSAGPLVPAGALGSAPAAVAPQAGYRMLAGDGGVFAFGTSYLGSAASDPSKCPVNITDRQMPNGTCWSIAATPDGAGYWILNASTGAVYTYGDARYFGSPADISPSPPRDLIPNYLAIAPTPDGQGYWLLALGGSGLGLVSAYGDARFYGDETRAPITEHLGSPVALVPTHTGRGYWIVDSDGGVFSFGDAVFHGSAATLRLNAKVVGAAATSDGGGYWLVALDGGVFSFGDARFSGSAAGLPLAKPVVGMATNRAGPGYWLAAADGGVFSFGGAPFQGSLAGTKLAQPVFSITAG